VKPNIDVMVRTSQRMVDFDREEFDVAIRVGGGTYPGQRAVYLMADLSFPVCSPRLLRGRGAPRKPEDLRHHTLLHDWADSREQYAPNWRNWLRHAKVPGVDADRGPGFSDTGMAIQAAIAGQGVALGRRSLVFDDLKAGYLVRPFGPVMPAPFSYYLVYPKTVVERDKVRSFREWLLNGICQDSAEKSWPRATSERRATSHVE